MYGHNFPQTKQEQEQKQKGSVNALQEVSCVNNESPKKVSQTSKRDQQTESKKININ